MNSSEWIERDLVMIGTLLMATGFAVVASRRHLITVLLGLQTSLLGAIMLASGWTDSFGLSFCAAIVFGGSLAVTVAFVFVIAQKSHGESLSIGPLHEADASDRYG